MIENTFALIKNLSLFGILAPVVFLVSDVARIPGIVFGVWFYTGAIIFLLSFFNISYFLFRKGTEVKK